MTGPEQLTEWIRRRFPNSDRRGRDAADLFGWHESILSKFASGDRRPGLDNALVIERLTGIPVETWASSELDKSPSADGEKARKRQVA